MTKKENLNFRAKKETFSVKRIREENLIFCAKKYNKRKKLILALKSLKGSVEILK